jgi:hypothetical protein
MAESPIDKLIDEVLGGDFDAEQRAKVADEVAYQYFSKVREQAGGELDAETAQQINSLVPIPQEDKGDPSNAPAAVVTMQNLLPAFCADSSSNSKPEHIATDTQL